MTRQELLLKDENAELKESIAALKKTNAELKIRLEAIIEAEAKGIRVTPTPEETLLFICNMTAVPDTQITSKTKERGIVYARQLVYYAWVDLLGLTSVSVGKQLKRDHSTVLMGKKQLMGLAETYPNIKADIDILRHFCKSTHINPTPES